MIEILVVYADGLQVWSRPLFLPAGATIMQALQATDFAQCYPARDIQKLPTGVFGKRLPHSHILTDGDRLEIYRALIFDPKQSRRRRALHRQKIRNIKKKVPVNDSTI